MSPRILYEDNHLLAAVKPYMMPSQADSSLSEDMLSLMKRYIKEKYGKPGAVYLGLVHRLDRPAGGVMVFARTSKAAARLAEQMKNGQFEKTYLAVTAGELPASGVLRDRLIKDEAANLTRVCAEGEGKYAELAYEVVERQGGLSLARIALKTGRSHQIRVQFASRGWPLYGDARYGGGEGAHLALFSAAVSIMHPTRNERLTFAAVPEGKPFTDFKYIREKIPQK